MKRPSKKLIVTVEKTDTGFSAFAEDVNVFTTASDIAELTTNLLEALNLHFEENGIIVRPDDLRLTIDLPQFFRYYRVLNASFLAKRIGMNPTLLSQYVNGQKRPSQRQVRRIMAGIQDIGKELASIDLL